MGGKRLIYIYDSLCGWCYVASPVMKQISNYAFENGMTFEFHHRRLFTNEHVPFMSDEFLRMIRRVGSETAPKMTGIAFSEQYYELVKSKAFVHDSHLTALGIAVAKQLTSDDEIAFDYGKRLQDLIFQEGQNPSSVKTIINAAQGLFDVDEFTKTLGRESTNKLVLEESNTAMDYSAKFNESGIPFLYYYNEEEGHNIKLDPYRFDKTKEILEKLKF